MRTATLAMLMTLWGVGCGDDEATPTGDGGALPLVDAAPGECVAPLTEYCDGPCPTFDQAVAELEDFGGRCLVAESGDCGPLRYVRFSGGFSGYTAWFTTSGDGTLVAAEQSTDTNAYCDGSSFTMAFGPTPSCTRHPTVQYDCVP